MKSLKPFLEVHDIDCLPAKTLRVISSNQKGLSCFDGRPSNAVLGRQVWAPSPFTRPHREAEAITFTHCKQHQWAS